MNQRRRRLHLTAAGLVLLASAVGLARLRAPEPGPAGAPDLAAGPAVYRIDGGQRIGPGGSLRPNPLTRLNLGRRIELAAVHPAFLAALPGLGEKSAARAHAEGRLPARARPSLDGLVRETRAEGPGPIADKP